MDVALAHPGNAEPGWVPSQPRAHSVGDGARSHVLCGHGTDTERAEQGEGVGGGGARFGLVDDELLGGGTVDGEGLVVQFQVADLGVVEELGLAGLAAYVVARPGSE